MGKEAELQPSTTTANLTRVLVDNSILNISRSAEEVPIDPMPEWPFPNKMALLRGVRGKYRIPPHHKFIISQVDCLPTVARLARSGVLQLYSYSETWLEWIGSPDSLSLRCTNIFGDDVTFYELPPAVERSRLYRMDLDSLRKKENKRKFLQAVAMYRR